MRKTLGLCIAIVLGVILGVYSIRYEPEQESYYTTRNIAIFCHDESHKQECVPFDQYTKSIDRRFEALGFDGTKGATRITREAFIQDAFQAMSALVTFGVTEADAAEFISSSITRGRERAGNLSTFDAAELLERYRNEPSRRSGSKDVESGSSMSR